MTVPVLLRTEVSLRVHGLPTLWTDGPPMLDDFHPPASQGARLGTGTPKTNDCSFFGIIAIHQDFTSNNNDQITLFIISQADFSGSEDGFNRRVDAHVFCYKFRRRIRKARALCVNLRQELFDTHRERLELHLFYDDRHGSRRLPGLNVKYTLARRADCICRDMVTGININFKTWHHSVLGKIWS